MAGRTGQEYNERKDRGGAFREDRYHATAIDTQDYLWQRMLYIDCNMVRAGVVTHPSEWTHCGYNEIVEPVSGYRVIDNKKLVSYFGFLNRENFLAEYRNCVKNAASSGRPQGRDDRWSKSVAVGDRTFLEGLSGLLGVKTKDRMIEENAGISFLKEPQSAYWGDFKVENSALRGENSHFLEPL